MNKPSDRDWLGEWTALIKAVFWLGILILLFMFVGPVKTILTGVPEMLKRTNGLTVGDFKLDMDRLAAMDSDVQGALQSLSPEAAVSILDFPTDEVLPLDVNGTQRPHFAVLLGAGLVKRGDWEDPKHPGIIVRRGVARTERGKRAYDVVLQAVKSLVATSN